MRRTLLLVGLVGLLIASSTSAIFAAEVVTDTSYYAPGDTASISGSGYLPGETVTIRITPSSGEPLAEPWDVAADQNGKFVTLWEIPEAALVPDVVLIEGVVPAKEPVPSTTVTLAEKTYLDQLQNGTGTSNPNWSTGNINSTNSCYSEGRLVPFRYFVKELDASTEHYFTIQCEWTKNGLHAYDYYADYDISESAGISSAGGVCGTISTSPPPGCSSPTESFAFPDPTNGANYSGSLPGDFFPSGFSLAAPMTLQAYNVTIDSLSNYFFTGSDPNYEFNVIVYFTVESTGSVGFFWGGHLSQSTSNTWGYGNGSGFIGGAAYHMRAQDFDGGGGGGKDRSIQNTALCTPPNSAITCDSDTVCTGSTYTCEADTGASSYDWTVTGATIISGQGTNAITYTVTAGYGGTVTLSLYACNDQSGCPGDYCCSEETVELMVGNCCDPPVATCPNDTTLLVCDLSEICLPGFDCTHSATVIGGYLSGNSVCFTPTVGLNTLTLICTNECLSADTCSVDVTVVMNSAPVCNLPSDGSYFVCGDSTFSFPVSATDSDGNLVGCTMTAGDGSFDGSNWTFTTSGPGTYTGTFECSDECGATCSGTVTITVGYNSAPVCSIPTDATYFLCADSTFVFPISATDVDGNLVGCTMTAGDGSFDGSDWTFTTSGPGTYSASFECTDECGATCSGSVTITIENNTAPVCSLPANGSYFVCGDTTFTFPVSATDADGNLVGCTMTSGDGSFDGSNWTFTTSGPGTYTGTFECSDACGAACSGTVTITVGYNSAPVCSLPSDGSYFVCDDSTFTFPVSATDVDGNLVGCTMTSGDGAFDGSNWTFTTSGPGTYTGTFECTDECGATCTGTVTITVGYNSAPVCSIPTDATYFLCADSTFVFPISATDVDGNLVGCTMTSGDGSFDGSNWTFTTSGPGTYSATFECADECGATCSGTVNITVDYNSAPVCVIPDDMTYFLCGDSTFSFPVSATDVDGNLVGCTMTSGDGSFDGSNWTFTATGPGTYSADFECADECGEVCTGSVTITIEFNTPPVCNLPSDASYFVCGDTTFSFPVSATDDNLVGCTMTAGDGSFDGSNWTFTTSGPGTYTGTFECTDECGATCTGTVTITVGYNSAPVCSLPSDGNYFVCDDSTFTFPVSAADVDGNLVGCTMTSGDGSFDGSNWTFTTSGPGTYTGTFECTDECGATCSGTVNITVDYNSAPVCVIPDDMTYFLCGDSTFSFPVSATDVDGNLVGCTMTSGDGSFDGSNWTFSTSGPGSYSATFVCTDECGATCSGTVTINIENNTAPVCNLPSDGSYFLCGDSTFTFPVSATDVDGNLDGCTMTSGDGSFDGDNWTFTTSGPGTYSATFECADSCGATCSGTVTITTANNTPPVCNLPSDGTYFVCYDTTFAFPVSASDVDGNLVGCTMTSGDGSFDGSTWTFTTSGSGTYTGTFECADACGEVCGRTVTIVVNLNSAPVCNIPPGGSFFLCEDTTITVPISATDVDGNLVGCTMTSGPGSFDGSNWTFTTSGSGTYSAMFECVDECGATCSGSIEFDVIVNSAPVCNLPDDDSYFICGDSTFSFPVSATDIDGNLVGCVMTSGVGSFDGSTWTFTATTAGTYTATFECTDECGAVCSGTATMTIGINTPPVCNLPDDDSYFLCADSTFSFPISATDADGNLVGCTMTSGNGSFDGSTWTFTTSGSGTYSGTFQCEDACGEVCIATVNITVGINAPPVCDIPSDDTFFVCGDTTFSFPVSATDVDGNLVGCTKTSGDGTFDGSTWTFSATESDTFTAAFECSDACGETCAGSATMIVNINAAPTCNLPDDASYFICDDSTFSFPVSAVDPDGNLAGCTKTSGPGTFDGSTWTFTANASGTYSGTFECADDCGVTCSGTVNITVTKNSPPVCHVPTVTEIGQCEPTPVSLAVYGTDVDTNLVSCSLVSGPGSLSGGMWNYTPSGDETVNVTVECTDACGATCQQSFQIDFVMDQAYCVPPVITIEKTHNTYQGHYEYVSITIENNPIEMGGFDFLIAYDASALTPVEVLPGQLLLDCGWEYFTYRNGPQGNCGGPCPSGLIRIVALAELNNGPNHPDCFGAPDTDPHELAVIKFYVTSDRTFECQYIPIKFYWFDCGDNSISNVPGTVLYIDSKIYAYDLGGLIWDEADDVTYPEDSRPFGLGAPDYCLNPDPDKPTAVRLLEFRYGGIDIVCADSIDLRGDLNLNDVPNEIADGVLYTNYFIYGLGVFTINPEGQVAASDVNGDGRVLTVGDLVYLIRIITGDALALAKLTPYADGVEFGVDRTTDELVLRSSSSSSIGAARFVFSLGDPTASVEAKLADDIDGMEMKSDVVDGQLRVLVYSFDGGKIPSGSNEILTITVDTQIELVDQEAADYNGSDLRVSVKELALPTEFTVTQNFPNPFNPETEILLSLPTASTWNVTVYNIAGQVVRSYDGSSAAGQVSVIWDGRDASGTAVASGIYFYRVTAGEYSITKKMVLMK